ncbi:hypothetical protein EV356DRAFT_89409 [Viridothelium virens]|uniref:DUF6594 domain-containing protein n=1 Tax=Viridothelium virens TaxID=1048519 RepID=A0A6A6HCZ1_VIRVR|nr:hypothetical protein EV356DRAFT_89409 [Viridothelium virens]
MPSMQRLTNGAATAVQNYEYFKKTTSPLGEVLVMGDSGGPTWKSTYEFAMRLREARSLLDGQDRIARQHEIITEWRQSLGKSLWDEKLRNRLPTDELHQFALRLLVATLGGLSLVVPMLVMSIHPSQTKSLVTTSAFVIFFGIGMATFVPQAEYKDLLGSTAAYAAVLVVFVGVGAGT